MPYNFQQIKDKVKELDLPNGKYILVGGSSLSARGIRETKDLDIVVLPELFEKLIEGGWELDNEYKDKWNRRRIIDGDVEIYPDLYLEKQNIFVDLENLISDADVIEGIPLQPLNHLIMCKLDSGRDKDLKDVDLIRSFINS